jgi:uncharacterized repeat protein (TIGR02543 family)
MDADKIITANFAEIVPEYSLTIGAENGSVTADPDQATYTSGTVVSLTAIADEGYMFDGWSGDATGSANPISVIMNSDKNITANFSQVPESSCGEILSGTLQFEICEPYENQVFDVGEPIVIKGNFSSDIVEVEAFYGNWNWIGVSNSSPYDITWSDATEGTYTLTVRGKDASGAQTNKETVNIEVVNSLKNASGDDVQANHRELLIYPNPVNRGGYITVNLMGYEEEESIKISIANLGGQTVYQSKVTVSENNSDNLEIETSQFETGLYILSVQSQTKNEMSKFIVK